MASEPYEREYGEVVISSEAQRVYTACSWFSDEIDVIEAQTGNLRHSYPRLCGLQLETAPQPDMIQVRDLERHFILSNEFSGTVYNQSTPIRPFCIAG